MNDSPVVVPGRIETAADDFSRLYRLHAPAIRAMIERYSGDPCLAEDITQETFLRAYCAGVRFGSHKAARKWLGIVAGRLYSNAQRRRRSAARAEAEAAHRARLGTDPAEGSTSGDVAVLAPLPPRYRRALYLKYVEEFSYEEIRAIEGLSERATYSLVHRAREDLKRRTARSARRRGADHERTRRHRLAIGRTDSNHCNARNAHPPPTTPTAVVPLPSEVSSAGGAFSECRERCGGR